MTAFDTLSQDLRYSLRALARSPAFTLVAIATLALGIGANTALFSLMDAILLRWLPVRDPQQLVVLARNPADPEAYFSYPDYRFVRDHSRSYTGVMAYSSGRPISFRLPAQGSTELVAASLVTGNYFDVLGVTPALGRVFNAADNEKENGHPYAVVSHSFWRKALGGDTAIVGRDILLNGTRFQIVGVTREGFTGPTVGVSPDVFVPLVMYPAFQPAARMWNTRNMTWLNILGRLKPGTTSGQAQSELTVLFARIEETDPNRRPTPAWVKDAQLRRQAVLLPGSQGFSQLRTQAGKPLTILMATVVFVLLIACANVANLLLARAAARQREIAVRLAVGARRGRLVRQMLTESVVLSVLGGLAGLAVASVGVKVLVSFLPRGAFPTHLDVNLDLRLLGFACGLSLLTGLLFGLLPAVRASRPDLVPALKTDAGTGGPGTRRWDLRRTLVSVQVALSLLLLVGAGLFVRTLTNLRDLDPGMVRENLLFVDTNVGQRGYQPQQERVFLDRLRDQVQRLPGVRAASLASITPLSGSRWNSNVQVENYTWRPDERPIVDMNAVTPRYFEAAGIPIVLGRDFRAADSLSVLPDRPATPPPPGVEPPDVPGPPRVAIVNEAFAQKFFRGQSPVGRRLSQGEKWNAARTTEIVGVVRNARYFNLRQAVEPMVYQPAFREGVVHTLCVRTTGDPYALNASIRRLVGSLDEAVSVVESRTMEDNLDRTLTQERFVALLGGFFGVVALVLAAIGLYGVMAQAVSRRTREIGIRMALGAEQRRVLWLVLQDALVMVVVGAVIGVPAALALTRYTESLLYGVKAQDPVTIALAAILLAAVTALASFLPARRATQVDPMVALRYE